MIRTIQQLYDLPIERVFMHEKYYYFYHNEHLHIWMQTTMKEDDVRTSSDIATVLQRLGEPVATIIPTEKSIQLASFNDQQWLLFRVVPMKRTFDANCLIRFHQAGMIYAQQHLQQEQLGMWHTLFEERYQQCKEWEKEIKDETKRALFIYMYGLLDQSIQLVGEVERYEREYLLMEGTVCFDSLPESLWREKDAYAFFNHQLFIDHPIRDVTEYARFMIEKGNITEALTFFHDYAVETDLFEGAYRLFLGRLLYPKTLLNIVERWVTIKTNEQKKYMHYVLKQYEQKIPIIERALRQVYQSMQQTYPSIIPTISWLEDDSYTKK